MRERSPDALAADALAKLFFGRPEAAVERLEEAADRSPGDGLIWARLAAGLLEQARAQGSARDLFRSLDAAEKAVAAAPESLEAAFNRAVALELLGITWVAKPAWEDYLQRESRGPWANEARSRLSRLTAPAEEVWEEARRQLEAAALADDRLRTRETVAKFRHQSQRLGLDELLLRWAESVRAGEVEEAAFSLHQADQIGLALEAVAGESLLADATAAIRRRVGGAEEPRLAEAQVLLQKGLAAYEAYEIEGASKALRLAEREFGRLGSPLHLQASFHLAQCQFQAHAYPGARSILQRVRRLAGRYPTLRARCAQVEGLVLTIQSEYQEALLLYQEGLEVAEATEDPELLAAFHHLLFEYFFTLGQGDDAWEHLHRAVRLLPGLKDDRRKQLIIDGAAVAAAAEEQPTIALYFQDRAVALAEAADSPTRLAASLHARAGSRRSVGMTDEALSDIRAAHDSATRVADAKVRAGLLGDILLDEARLLTDSDPSRALAVYDEAVALLQETGYRYQLARSLAERAAARRRLGDGAEAERDLLAAIAEVEAQAGALAEGRISFLDQRLGLYDEGVRMYLEAGDSASAFALVERAKAPSLLAAYRTRAKLRGEPTEAVPATLEAIAERLPEGAVLLDFVVLAAETLVWHVERAGARLVRVPLGDQELRILVRRLLEAAGRQDGETVRSLSSQLDPLVAGLDSEPGRVPSRLIVVPDRALHQLPFALLHPRGEGPLLISQFSLEVAPSARVYLEALEASRRRPLPPAPSFLLVGASEFDRRPAPRLPTLPLAHLEATAIYRRFPRSVLLAGAEASKRTLLTQLASVDGLHVAAHGLPNRSQPELSALLLAADGRSATSGMLSAHEIASRDLSHLSLAVLSACSGAGGEVSRSEGTLSLVRAFLSAGVPTVVASLWDLDDRAALDLMTRFYQNLAGGLPAADALREAQLALLGHGGKGSTGYEWAGFMTFGAGSAG